MRCLIVLLALVALGACKPRAADQSLLNKQQDVLQLLQKISQPIPNQQLQNLGATYDIEANAHQYQNPIIVKYFGAAVRSGLVQPKGTTYSNSISELRKEVSLLYRILLGANDYQTFLKTAAWARVHVNELQFVKALAAAVLTRQDTQGVILPPPYEILPQYHLDARIIQEAQDIAIQGIETGTIQNVLIPVNYSALLSQDEQQLSYFTQDIGLAAYYSYVNLVGYILGDEQQQQGPQPLTQQQYQQQIVGKYLQQQPGQQSQQSPIGHGAKYLFQHQQLLALYELNRLSNGLGPINEIDYQNVQAPYEPHLRTLNGLSFPGRPQNLQLQAQKNKLIKLVTILEERLMEAIDSGHVVTPQGIFLSLYQPQGMNILGDLIEGCGRSVNPRYYGSIQAVARKLLGNAPEAQNIWDYTPSALEIEQTAVHDPAFYQLFKKVMNLYQKYQESLPAYQYNDLILPGVSIQNVDVSQLITVFSDYFINLDSVIPRPPGQQQQPQQPQQPPQQPHSPQQPQQPQQPQPQQVSQHVQAHLKRLDHLPYVYKVVAHSEQSVPNAVIRVFIGPKHNYQGQPISITKNPQLFVQLDQFIQNLHPGQNIILRSSQQAPGQSADWPSTANIQEGVNNAIRSQSPFFVTEPQNIYGLPARLSLPKGQQQGFPLQLLVVISGPGTLQVPYGPVVPEQSLTYQAQQYQLVNPEQYQQLKQQGQLNQVSGGIQQNVEVLPENLVSAQKLNPVVRNHFANVYTKYHGQYPHTQVQNPVGEGQDMTYTIQGVGMLSSEVVGQLGLHQNIVPQSAQQSQQAQQIQSQIQQGVVAGQQYQPTSQAARTIWDQAHHAHVWSQSGIAGGVQTGQQGLQQGLQGMQQPGLATSQSVQQAIQGVQAGQGVQGTPQGVPSLQGIQVGQQGIPSPVPVGLQQGVQQVWGQAGQGVQSVKAVYRSQVGQWPGQVTPVQGGINGIVGSGQQHAGGFQNVFMPQQQESVEQQATSEYFQSKPITEVIGGSVSLDGKPLGFPLDRQLTPGALSVPNIFVKDVLVFHQGPPTNDIVQSQQ